MSESLVQDRSSSYGKIISIDVTPGRSNIHTIGHRNPQGLFMEQDGTLWATEHGPHGGDELNILHGGGNYGWPLVTYGTARGS